MDYHVETLMVEHDAPKEVLYEIGALIATAASIDFDIGWQMARLATGKENQGVFLHPMTTGMDFRVKMAVTRALACHYEKHALRIQRTCDKLQELYQRRNDVAHLSIVGSRGDVCYFQAYRVDPKTGKLPPPKPLRASQVRRWAVKLEGWAIRLDELVSEALALLHEPSPEPALARATPARNARKTPARPKPPPR